MSGTDTAPRRSGLAISQALTRPLLVAGCERTGFGLVVAAGAGSYLVTEILNQPAQEEPASEPDVLDEPEPRFARDAAATTTA